MKADNFQEISDLMKDRINIERRKQKAERLIDCLEDPVKTNPTITVSGALDHLDMDGTDDEITMMALMEYVTKQENLMADIDKKLKPL